MDGIERIAARIREDAEQEIARMNQEATEQVEAIQAQAQAQASREREEILARGRRAADERLERLKSAALMQRRTLELGAQYDKQGFYEAVGFAPYGEPYLDEGYPHVPMRMAL